MIQTLQNKEHISHKFTLVNNHPFNLKESEWFQDHFK